MSLTLSRPRSTRARARHRSLRHAAVACAALVVAIGTLPGTARVAGAARATAAESAAAPDSVLATVDGYVITKGMFVRTWESMLPNVRPEGDALTSRRTMVDRMVDRRLLVLEASKFTFPLTEEQKQDYARFRRTVILNRYFDLRIGTQAALTPEELDLAKNMFTTYPSVRTFKFADEATARTWLARLRGGTPVSQLTERIAAGEIPGAVTDSLGWVRYETVGKLLRPAVFGTKVGRVSDLVFIDGKPGFVHVMGTRVRLGIELNSPRALYDSAIKLRTNELKEQYRAELRDTLQLRYDDSTATYALARFQALPPRIKEDEKGATLKVYLPMPAFVPADSNLILARTITGEYRLGGYLDYYRNLPNEIRPEIRTREMLEASADTWVLGDELMRRAVAAGVESDPLVAEQLNRRQEGYRIENYYDHKIMGAVPTSLDSLKAYFRAYPKRWDTPESVKLSILVLERKSLADSAAAEIKTGAPFDRFAPFSVHDSGENGGDAGTLYKGRNAETELEDQIFAAPEGVVVGPITVRNGYAVFRCEKKEGYVSRNFEQARQYCEQDYRTETSERILKQTLERLRSKAKIVTYPDHVTEDLGI